MQGLPGQLGPHEHARARLLYLPSRFREGVNEHVSSLPVLLYRMLHLAFELVQGDRRGHLYRGEHTVVEPALYLLKRAHEFRVSHYETDPPAGHVVAFGERVALHRHIFRTVYGKDRGGLVAVERYIGICYVAYYVEALLFSRIDQPFVKCRRNGRRTRVVREVDDDIFGSRYRLDKRLFEVYEE